VFEDTQDASFLTGGMGDRMAGAISAFAYSILSDRVLLIESSPGVVDYFGPYHRPSYSISDTHGMPVTEVMCVNSGGHCLFKEDVTAPVIRLKMNRAILCWWLELGFFKPNVTGFKASGRRVDFDKKKAFDVLDDPSELFMNAGCMLRLLFWPTESLWKEVYSRMKKMNHRLLSAQFRYEIDQNPINVCTWTKAISLLTLCRCGDKSFKANSEYSRERWPCYEQKVHINYMRS